MSSSLIHYCDFDKLITRVEREKDCSENKEAEPFIAGDVDIKDVNELMDEMIEFYNQSEDTSAPVEESLAKTVNASLRSQIPKKQFKEIKSRYKRPENCKNLMIPPVNEEVWTEKHPQMNAIRSRDLKLQTIMGGLIKGMIPVIETANDVLKAGLKKEQFNASANLRRITDGIRIIAQSLTHLNHYRKDNFKPMLNGKFK